MRAVVGTLELELHRHPLSLSGQFRVAPAEPEARPLAEQALPLVAGAVLVLPAVVALGVAVLAPLFGLTALYNVLTRSPALALVVAASLFVGAPLAILINLWPILRFGLRRDAEEIAAEVALRPNLLQLALLLVAVAVAAVFFGHLIADQWACWNGLTSAC